MIRLISPSWLATVMVALFSAGCHTPDRSAYPEDPLFVSKRPIEVKPEKSVTHLVQHTEPARTVRGARP